MPASLVRFFLLCSLALGMPFQDVETVREELPDGSTIVRAVRVGAAGERVSHGPFEHRAADGTVLAEGEFEDGRASGRWRLRHPRGEVLGSGKYRNGERVGEWKFQYPNGTRRAVGLFREGRPHGEWELDYPHGRPWARGKFQEGELVGSWTLFQETGIEEPRESGAYAAQRTSWPDGTPRAEGFTLDGVPHGAWTVWWPSGREMLRADLLRGRRAGSWSFTHADGTPDPEMQAGPYGAPTIAGGLLEELEALDRMGSEYLPAPTAETRVPAVEHAAPESAAEIPAELAARLARALGKYRGADEDERKAAVQELLAAGLDALHPVLEMLREIDPTETEPSKLAGRVREELLLPLLGAQAFEWQEGTESEAVAANRLTLDRWESFRQRCSLPALYRSADLGQRAKGAVRTALLCFPLEELGECAGLPPPPCYARRSLPREGAAEDALQNGLRWLARHQDADGRWDADGFMKHDPERERCDGAGSDVHDAGVTSLALLAFLGAGNTPHSGEHASVVSAAAGWLVQQMDPRTGQIMAPRITVDEETGKRRLVFPSLWAYDHALATLALAEAAAVSPDPALLETVRRAVEVIHAMRNPSGAWRYDLPPTGESDTSVTCWMVRALIAAREAGVTVDPEALAGAAKWIDDMTEAATGRVGYDSPGSTSARVPSVNEQYPVENGEALTAAGLLSRILLGQDRRTTPILQKHAELIVKTLPKWEALGNDMCYWYFGSYAMFQMGGPKWDSWNDALGHAVLESQRHDGAHKGSWDPAGPWGWAGGRVYSTAMMVLTLEAPFALELASR